jgi:hypothetical protein
MWARFVSKVFPRLAAKRPYGEIEPKVKPLVDSMNATGLIKTLASCQGHGALGKSPYVYFKAPVKIAASIEQLLREATLSEDVRLQKVWVIEGRFDENYDLTFILHSPECYESSHSLWSLVFFWFLRKRIDAELLSLASIVEKAVLLNIGEIHKPYIAAHGD